MNHPKLGALLLLATCWAACTAASAGSTPRPCKAPRANLKERVAWGALCEQPAGAGLAFGGQDQKAEDGRPHTRVRKDGGWVSIVEELRRKNPLQKFHKRAWLLRNKVKNLAAGARYLYFQGRASKPAPVLEGMRKAEKDLEVLVGELKATAFKLEKYEAGQIGFALTSLEKADGEMGVVRGRYGSGISAGEIKRMRQAQVALEQASEALDAEPPARVTGAIAYEGKTGLYVLFGGDHYDYLTSDTWVFDPQAVKWMQRHPAGAPAPRGGHKLLAAGDGKVRLSGGYTYRFSLNYAAAQYGQVEGGEWVYDVAANTWTGGGKAHPPAARVYREGPFLPGHFLEGEAPNAAKHEARLKSLPANTWVEMKPPQYPKMNRDWGTAVFDFDRDLILFWSGGHCAHGGTDVLHYHPATGRWELPCPVELPLGQLYVGGELYPAGFNFNGRPWMNGHTRKTYGYDRRLKKMVFVAPPGGDRHFYVYDPDLADWSGRAPRPAGMIYSGAYHTLFVCCSPAGTYVWTGKGRLFSLDEKSLTWSEVKLAGEKLPGTSVDTCAITYDPGRDRLVCMKGWYGKAHDGQVYGIDRRTWTVKALNPAGRESMKRKFALRESVYCPEGDLILISVTGKDSLERTVAYDCAENRWVSLKIGGLKERKGYPLKYALPYSPSGNHSIGVRYDPRRKLFWAVNNWCRVWAMRLDLKTADVQPLK